MCFVATCPRFAAAAQCPGGRTRPSQGLRGSNPRPADLESAALPTELNPYRNPTLLADTGAIAASASLDVQLVRVARPPGARLVSTRIIGFLSRSERSAANRLAELGIPGVVWGENPRYLVSL